MSLYWAGRSSANPSSWVPGQFSLNLSWSLSSPPLVPYPWKKALMVWPSLMAAVSGWAES